MSNIPLQKFDYYRGPQRLSDLWTMRRDPLVLTCSLSTHRLGWEVRLAAGKNFSRSQVCRSEKEVFDTSAAWKAEAANQGWSE